MNYTFRVLTMPIGRLPVKVYTIPHMTNWITRFLKAPQTIGSVAPSSKYLGKLMTWDISSNAKVLEAGPGDGAITRHFFSRLKSPTQLTQIELDADLANICRSRFSGAKIINGDIDKILTDDQQTYDVIVSGIPFAALPKEKRLALFQLISKRLNLGGTFVMFQYSLTSRTELREIFSNVDIRFTPLNIPPAFVYVAKR